MSTVAVADPSPITRSHPPDRTAAAFYVLTFLTGGASLLLGGTAAVAAGLAAGAAYVVVTVLFYRIFRPAGPALSLIAAMVSLAGIVAGALAPLRLLPPALNGLVLFGVYCLLIGTLILRSDFLPRALGLLMLAAGLGWLVYLAPPLARSLYPYVLVPGLVGEGALTAWLLVRGVDLERWRAAAARERVS